MTLRDRLNLRLSVNTWIRIAVGVALVVAFLVHEAEWYQYRFIQQLELLAYDARLRFFMPKTLEPRVVILDIDEKSLAAEGRWPWSRDKMALMVRQLFDRYKVRVVGFDVVFSEADTSSGLASLEQLGRTVLKDNAEFQAFLAGARSTLDHDRIFADEIAKHPVVLGFFLGGKADKAGVLPMPTFTERAIGGDKGWEFMHHLASGYSANIEVIQKAATAAGHLYPSLDFDGVTRRVPVFMKYEDGYYETLSFAMTRAYLGNVPAKIRVVEPSVGKIASVPAVEIGPLSIPLDERMSALIPYRGSGGVYRYVSATDVMRDKVPADDLRDKIVIVGTSAQGLLDLRSTPVREDFPGVEVHANLVSGFLDQRIMHKPDLVLAISFFTVLLAGLPLALLLPRLSALASTAAVAGLALVVLALNLYVWSAHNLVLNVAAPISLLGLLYLINMAWGFFMETRSRMLISGLFGTYVPKELVAEMSKNPEEYSMRGESREMTVLFSDVRDFTSISEGLTPEQLTDLMNTYLTEMTEVIQERRGTIDKYIGDAIMAFWGAPLADAEHAKHGVEAALDMQKRIRKLDPEFARRGWPPLHVGVGLNCGPMSVGDMGSRFRRAYTVMGDAVNLSSRCEGLTKEYGVGILVTENVVREARDFVYREVDRVVVKGRSEGVGVYEPVGRVGEVGETTLAELDTFHKALEHYRKQRWDEADALIRKLSYAAPDFKLYKLYLKRLAHFREHTPGPAWNGLWVFTTK
ncbi:MAG TPA: adenylate/guanylate cyclase domain-containing protein [Usitatibacter sp.]|nr:adenylate/guanylate cyclase domain-containing protein [Usitatibacter sp.]